MRLNTSQLGEVYKNLFQTKEQTDNNSEWRNIPNTK